MSLIVLEGCDGAGKTTLSNVLAELYNAEVIHATRETPNDWKWFSEIMDQARDRNIIADRFFWGQFVYQEPEERHLSLEQLRELEYRLEQEGGKMLYVTAEPSDILSRLQQRSEELSASLGQILSRYAFCVQSANCPVITYNTSKGEVIG